MRQILFVLMLLGASVAAPAALGASQSASFSLSPVHFDPHLEASRSYFIIRAVPGETITNSVLVSNVGGAAGSLALYPADATTGASSGAAYEGRAASRRDVGSWLSLGSSRLSLAAHSSRTVPITLHIPRNAKPGDHLGGIVAQNLQLSGPSRQSGTVHVRIRRLTIAAVLVQIPGRTIAQLKLDGVRAGGGRGYQYVYVRLANTGNLMVKPHGRLLVVNRKGKTIADVPLKLDYVLPRTSIDYPVLLPGVVLAPGRYTVRVKLSYAAGPLGYRTTSGRRKTVAASFPLTISRPQQRQVYKGAPPALAPTSATLPAYVWFGGFAALLLACSAAVLLGIRRWAHRR